LSLPRLPIPPQGQADKLLALHGGKINKQAHTASIEPACACPAAAQNRHGRRARTRLEGRNFKRRKAQVLAAGQHMIRALYDWVLSLAGRKGAQVWLAVIAFIESSFFLIPADVLFVPMALARPQRAYRYAIIATLFSVLGGILGWYIGFYAFEAVARPVLEFYGKYDSFEMLRGSAGADAILLMLVTSGLSHLPPIKVVTILSGAVGVNIWLFIVSAILARGARFLALAWLLRTYGEPIKAFIEKRLKLIAALAAAAVLALYFVVRYFLH
jgi:membrane protein YqaA with SNARE-associated domain